MLQVEGLRHRFAGAQTLAFADISVEPGSTVLIRGASGSGKSTLLALLAGLLTVQQGKVQVAGADLAQLDPVQRDAWRAAHLGVMPQRLHLSPYLSVRLNLELVYVAAAAPVDSARIDSVLAALGLKDLSERRPHQLSLGQAQRVALARAVLRRPKLLLVDEPSANLDDAAAASMLDLLGAHARESDSGLIVATHDARVCQAWPHARQWPLGAPT